MFCKLYETEEFGQILIMRHGSEDCALLTVFTEHPLEGRDTIISLNNDFPLTKAGLGMCNQLFDAADEPMVRDLVRQFTTKILEQHAAKGVEDCKACVEGSNWTGNAGEQVSCDTCEYKRYKNAVSGDDASSEAEPDTLSEEEAQG